MLIGAIDPGKNGGFALFDTDTGKLVEAGRLQFDNPRYLYMKFFECTEIIIEEVHGSSNQGQSQAFEFGRAHGRAEAAAMMTGADIYYVSPQWWKGKLAVSTDKKKATDKALKLIPGLNRFVKLAKDDGAAEAALLGLFLIRPELRKEVTRLTDKRARPKKKRVSFRL